MTSKTNWRGITVLTLSFGLSISVILLIVETMLHPGAISDAESTVISTVLGALVGLLAGALGSRHFETDNPPEGGTGNKGTDLE
jgi:hypothetical protein